MKKIIGAMLIAMCTAACANDWQKKANETGKPYAVFQTSMGTIVVELNPQNAPKTVENFIGLATGTREWTDPRSNQKVKRPFYDKLIFHRVIKDFMVQGGCPNGNGTGGPGYSFEDETYDMTGATELKGPISTEEIAMKVYMDIIVPYLRATQNPDADIKNIAIACSQNQNGKAIMNHPVEYYKQKTGASKPIYSGGTVKAKVAYGTLCMANAGPNTNGSQFFIVTKKEGCSWLDGKHTVFGTVVQGMDIAEKITNVKTVANDKPEKDVVLEKVVIYTKK